LSEIVLVIFKYTVYTYIYLEHVAIFEPDPFINLQEKRCWKLSRVQVNYETHPATTQLYQLGLIQRKSKERDRPSKHKSSSFL